MGENMPAANGKLRIAAMADLHVSEEENAPHRELFAEISKIADILVLAGDLTDFGKPREAVILAEELRSCSIPVVAVLGNHNYECGQIDEVKEIMRGAGVHVLDGSTFEYQGVGFVGVKGFAGGFGRRMLGAFGEQAYKAFVAESVSEALRLENAMRTVPNDRVLVVLHSAPVADTIDGEPLEIYPFLGSSRLGETIDRFKVSAIVHGHAHLGKYEGRTPAGQPVYNVASHVEKPTGLPYALLEI